MVKEVWSDSAGSYIRLIGDEKERIADRILGAHVIAGVLPLDIELVNGHREYVYETSGYQDLGSRLDERPLSKEQWIDALEQILQTGERLEEYLLDGEHLLMEPEMIFVAGDQPQVEMLYAGEHRKDLSEGMSRLVEQALKYPEYDRGSAEFLYRLHALVTRGGLTRKTLLEFLREEGGVSVRIGEPDPGEDTTKRSPIKRAKKTQTASKPKKETSTNPRKETATRPGKERRDTGLDKRVYYLPIGVLAAGVLIPSICFRCGCFQKPVSGETDITMMIVAYLFFMIVAGIGTYRLWPAKPPEIVWGEEDEITLCLLPQTATGGLRVMPVTMFPWRIGRDERQVDGQVEGDGIAPVHARFERENRSLFVVDEESQTGTQLNGRQLTPWERHRIKDGDIISLGSASYIVEISD
ncbi:MAG: DUF6382 domain-containing protein [Eubacterium sp.]|nr:DUF6382 domain-containing protein [Eubacterium sp.]